MFVPIAVQIPRYLIIDENGVIKVFNAIETTDKKLLNNLK